MIQASSDEGSGGLTLTPPALYDAAMSPRLRKFIGMIAILVFLAIYLLVAMAVGLRVPDHWWARLLYYSVVGILWGVPLFPVIKWMSREE